MYEVREAAQLTGLSLSTVGQYCSRATTLVRGRDYIVLRHARFGQVRNKLVITKLGLLRIATYDFRRLDRAQRRDPLPEPRRSIIERWWQECEDAGVGNGKPQNLDARMKRKQLWTARLAKALLDHPCRQQGCLCQCHVLANGCYKVRPGMSTGSLALRTFAF